MGRSAIKAREKYAWLAFKRWQTPQCVSEGNYNSLMKIHIRLIANESLSNTLISNVENYCKNCADFKIAISSSSAYWKNVNLRESNLCLSINANYSRECSTNVIVTLFRLRMENMTIIEDDETCEINCYAQLDDLTSFSDKFALFAYINKREH